MIRRSWVEIDLEQIKLNYNIYKKSTSKNIMAVVKADAYGHGAVKVAKLLQEEGVQNFAVSNVKEALELRENGINGIVLILGYTPIENLDLVKKYDITQALLSEDYVEDIINSGIRVRCHYAIDTGMNRIGIDANDVKNCVKVINRAAEHLNLNGLFTHLCVADTPSQDEFTNSQIKKFHNVVKAVENLRLDENHCLNSAGGLWHDTDSAFARLGIVLYGLKPDYDNLLPDGIKPAMKWKSVVSMIKIVEPGETIGYGRAYSVDKEMRIATIPTGYADGYNRRLSNKGFVIIRGQKAPIVGRVCMDQFMVDVTDIADVKNYDEVLLMCDEFNADDMANILGTIGYEVICDIGKRVERVYVGKGWTNDKKIKP